MASDSTCLFCRLVAGEVPADVVREDDRTVAFRDINPQAPTHVLVIPRDHYQNVAALAQHDPALTSAVYAAAAAVAEQEGVSDGYRLITNTGPAVGQSVFHVHVHVMGGRTMTWPPG